MDVPEFTDADIVAIADLRDRMLGCLGENGDFEEFERVRTSAEPRIADVATIVVIEVVKKRLQNVIEDANRRVALQANQAPPEAPNDL